MTLPQINGLSEPSARRLADLLGLTVGKHGMSLLEAPRAGGPTLVGVKGPDDDTSIVVDELLDALDSDLPGGRQVSRMLKRDRSRLLGHNASGEPTIDGRTCCWQVAKWLDKRLGQVQPGELFRCVGCGAVWTIANLVREERSHGR